MSHQISDLPKDARGNSELPHFAINPVAEALNRKDAQSDSLPAKHEVRNHGAVPALDWNTHRVTVAGLVPQPREWSMDELTALPSVTLPVTISCADKQSGSQANGARDANGNPVCAAFWRGVALSDVLRLAGVTASVEGAKFVCFEGADLPKHGTYGTSIPLDMALDPASNIILAYQMNDQPLTAAHGYPVRLVVPGWYGGRMIKWLKSIRVTSDESTSWYHRNGFEFEQ